MNPEREQLWIEVGILAVERGLPGDPEGPAGQGGREGRGSVVFSKSDFYGW